MAVIDNDTLLQWLQEDLRGEQQAAHQYLMAHWLCQGLLRPVYRELFRKWAIEEMKHLDELGEWIVRFGGVPDLLHPLAVENTMTPQQAVSRSLELEQMTVDRYTQRVHDLCDTEYEDLAQLYQTMLLEEAEHRNELLQMNGGEE
jgi:bacterioferritin (cytochrome b1)